MCEISRRFNYRLDSGLGFPKEPRTHFGINVGPFQMVSDFFSASFSKIQGEISHFSKAACKPSKSGKLQKQMPFPTFWRDFGVKMWPRKLCLGTQNAIFPPKKIGTFAKSANFLALKNGTLSVQMKNLKPLL